MQTACNNAWNAGLIIVAAAGNDGSSVDYPAAYSTVIAVTATNSADGYPSWSNYGSQAELSAPGVSIYSTAKGGGYTTESGTSMSTPHVSGVAALVLADDPTLTNSEVRTILQNTAEDLGPTGRDVHYGYGLVDAEAAVGPSEPDTTPPVITGVSTSDITHNSATVTWTTDDRSDSVVNYGTTTALGSTESDTALVTSHSISITGLTAETTYYYEVQSTNSDSYSSTDNNGGSYYQFTTLSEPEPQSMHVSNIYMWYKKAGPNYFVHTVVTIVDGTNAIPNNRNIHSYGHQCGQIRVDI
jgi:hypothetical protein